MRRENVMTRPSEPPVARIGWGEWEEERDGEGGESWSWQTRAVCPGRRAIQCLDSIMSELGLRMAGVGGKVTYPVSASQTRTVVSNPPLAIRTPSNATE